MKTEQIFIYLIIAMIYISACVDPISFETDSNNEQMVFFGTYNQLDEHHFFSLTTTASFSDIPRPVSNAVITIFDDQGRSANYMESDSGVYQLHSGVFPGVVGRSYHVEIDLPDGRSYYTDPQVLMSPVEIDNLYFKVENEKIVGGADILVDQTNININIYIDTPLNNGSEGVGGLRWLVEEAYSFSDLPCHPFFDPSLTCYFRIPTVESDVKLFQTTQKHLKGFQVHSRVLAPDDQFVERHYFSVYQYTLTESAYNYWERVKAVANQSGNLLDLPPARVSGNIIERGSNKTALGYFEVSGKHVSRIYTLPYLIEGAKILESCPESRSSIIQDKCCFCYLLDDPTNRITRPEYWGN